MLKLIREKLSSGMGRDMVWTFSIQLLIMLCSFAINKLLASRLSIDDFGQYNVIKRSVQVLSFLMLAGVGIALPRYIPLYRNSNPPRRIAPLMSASFNRCIAHRVDSLHALLGADGGYHHRPKR